MFPVSVCIIAKNEEQRIERCLSSILPYHFEIVIVDTGSTDRTKELASKYTDKVFDFVWCDDFSAARNFSLQMASNDWIFMLDCDEVIQSLDLEELDYFRKHLSHAVGSVNRENLVGTPENPGKTIDRTERFFSRKKYHYTGRIHEQLTPKYGQDMEAFLLNATLFHDGYLMDESARLQKAKRNLDLLHKQLEEEPNNPYLYYQLGKGYEMVYDLKKACEWYDKGLSFPLDSELAYVQAMVIAYGHALLQTGQKETALQFVNLYEDFSSNADFVYLMGLIYKENQYYELAIKEFQKALTFDFSNEEGVTGFLSYYQLGGILLALGQVAPAMKCLQMCGDYTPARQLLKSLSTIS